MNRSDVVSEYNDESSRAGGGSTIIAHSTISRVTVSSYQHAGMYHDNFNDLREYIRTRL